MALLCVSLCPSCCEEGVGLRFCFDVLQSAAQQSSLSLPSGSSSHVRLLPSNMWFRNRQSVCRAQLRSSLCLPFASLIVAYVGIASVCCGSACSLLGFGARRSSRLAPRPRQCGWRSRTCFSPATTMGSWTDSFARELRTRFVASMLTAAVFGHLLDHASPSAHTLAHP